MLKKTQLKVREFPPIPADLMFEKEKSYMSHFLNNMYTSFFKQIDDVLVTRLTELGFDSKDEDFIKENMQRIIQEGDPFEHFYYHYGQDDEIRILSIERELQMPPLALGEDFSSKMTISKRYY